MLKSHIIESGYFLGDGGVMFGPVPKKYWSAKYMVDEKNIQFFPHGSEAPSARRPLIYQKR